MISYLMRVLGGVMADWLSWRAGFFINVPIGPDGSSPILRTA
ncbi:hypothetical protein [Pseudomonas aegrilactucae]|nr:hypothetical protein [Pseudomonas aegrilactucae]